MSTAVRRASRIDAWLPWLRPLSGEARLLAHALRSGLWRALSRNGRTDGHDQRVLTWATSIPDAANAAAVVAHLRERGLRVHEGGNAFYLPPQAGLESALGPAVERYPPGSGFKILRDFRSLDEAHYLRPDRQTRLRRRLIGSPRDQLVAANYLHRLHLGPRVWDVCLLRAGRLSMPAFVVQHVAGTPPAPAEWSAFIDHLGAALAATELRITVPNWRRNKDFRCPGCNGNLLRDAAGTLHYIDFQNFSVRDPRRLQWSTLDAATYRSLRRHRRRGAPGDRFGAIRRALAAHGIGVENRLVAEIGCGAGTMLHDALAAGAWWALGWDRPEFAERAQAVAAALGFTRLDVAAARPSDPADLRAATPPWLRPHLAESVILLPGTQHLPPGGVAGAPWRAVVCSPPESATPIVLVREPTTSTGTSAR